MENQRIKDSSNESANIAILVTYPFFGNAFSSVLRALPNAEFVTDFSSKPPGMEHSEAGKQRLRAWLLSSGLPWRDFEMSGLTETEFFSKYSTLVASHQVGLVNHPALQRHRKARVFYGGAKDLWAFSLGNVYFDQIYTPGPFYTDTLNALYGGAGVVAFSTGEPKLDAFSRLTRETARAQLDITTGRPVVLYAPTWGALSSIRAVGGALMRLTKDYEVVLKTHHMITAFEPETLRVFDALPIRRIDDTADVSVALAAADVVVSDGSGMVIDAIVADKPLVIIDMVGESNTDFYIETAFYGEKEGVLVGTATSAQSPEQRMKYGETKIAQVVDYSSATNAHALERAVNEALSRPDRYAAARKKFLATHGMPLDGKAGERAAEKISSLSRLSVRGVWESEESLLRSVVRDFENKIKERDVVLHDELSKLKGHVEVFRTLRQLPFRKRLLEVERLFFS